MALEVAENKTASYSAEEQNGHRAHLVNRCLVHRLRCNEWRSHQALENQIPNQVHKRAEVLYMNLRSGHGDEERAFKLPNRRNAIGLAGMLITRSRWRGSSTQVV